MTLEGAVNEMHNQVLAKNVFLETKRAYIQVHERLTNIGARLKCSPNGEAETTAYVQLPMCCCQVLMVYS